MIFPTDSGFGRLKGCCSCQCAFKIGRTPVFVACLQAIQDVKSPASRLLPSSPVKLILNATWNQKSAEPGSVNSGLISGRSVNPHSLTLAATIILTSFELWIFRYRERQRVDGFPLAHARSYDNTCVLGALGCSVAASASERTDHHSLALAATRSGRPEVKNSTDGGMIPTSRDIWTMVEPHFLALAATSQKLNRRGA